MKSLQHISDLAALLNRMGVAGVVIAPGSRNAPLIQAFYREMPEKCKSIVDERSAGYFALGIAIKAQKPVVVITTSGTAVLNLGPAVAEAYYQKVPLIVLTADRPKEWLNQQDNQTILQADVFKNNCKKFFELPAEVKSTDDEWYSSRIISEAYNTASFGVQGPVHINIPLREPLYDDLPDPTDINEVVYTQSTKVSISSEMLNQWNNAERVMVVAGQTPLNNDLNNIVNQISKKLNVVVLGEPVSNIMGEDIIDNADLVLAKNMHPETPDLVIYFGGQVVSKRLKQYLRCAKKLKVWYLSEGGQHIDTFQHLSRVVDCDPGSFFQELNSLGNKKTDDYFKTWQNLKKKVSGEVKDLLSNSSYSDLWVHGNIVSKLALSDCLFAGNSSVVRYLQFFSPKCKEVYANRGTSGIDGCISTAAGIASLTNERIIVVVGDLSFIYDSNGLWNKELPSNLKIIIVNNSGGGIFSMIPGPAEQESFKQFFEANHPVSFKAIAEAFHLNYYKCENSDSFSDLYNEFYNSSGASLFEIITNNKDNNPVFHNFIENIRNYE